MQLKNTLSTIRLNFRFQIVLSRSTGISESADKEIPERILTPRARKMTMRVMRGKKATGTKGGKAKRLCQMSRAGKLNQAKALLRLSM